MKNSEELLNIYDDAGVVIGAMPRHAAKASGRPVGAVNLLLLNGQAQVLLQRRPADKENGNLWDKSVGGHVSAGEDFDTAMVREAGEELFDDPLCPRVRLCASDAAFQAALEASDLSRQLVLHRVAFAARLRDVRRTPGGGFLSVLYRLAIYLGRTEVKLSDFRPQASEIAELRYVSASQVDEWLLAGRLAPNMAYLWLTQAHELLALASGSGRRA